MLSKMKLLKVLRIKGAIYKVKPCKFPNRSKHAQTQLGNREPVQGEMLEMAHFFGTLTTKHKMWEASPQF